MDVKGKVNFGKKGRRTSTFQVKAFQWVDLRSQVEKTVAGPKVWTQNLEQWEIDKQYIDPFIKEECGGERIRD